MNRGLRESPTRTRLSHLRRVVLFGAVFGLALAARSATSSDLAEVLAARGLGVVTGSVRWLDGPKVIGPRRALLLAREGSGATDVYAVTCRTAGGDRVLDVLDVSNLTRSRDSDESSLVVASPWAAFATVVEGSVRAVTAVDTRGALPDPRLDRGARFRRMVTTLQRTGSARGYDLHRYEFSSPVPSVALRFDGAVLSFTSSDPVRVRMPDGAVLAGATAVRPRPRVEADPGSWITWAVDTVRAIRWVGTAPIAWAEDVAFRGRHAVVTARNASLGTDTAAAIREDLADLVSATASGPIEGRSEGWPPAPLRGGLDRTIAGEGEWLPLGGRDDPYVGSNPGAPRPMFLTFVRTDTERPDTRVYVVVWDPRQIEIHVGPGSIEPMGSTGETGSGVVPRDERTIRSLVGAFNGGFQGLHGEYGLLAEDALLLPPKPYSATVALMADGSTAFGSWPPGQSTIPDGMVEFRQNLTPMIDGGVYNPWQRQSWGAVLNTLPDLRTARSGLCLSREGYVEFFWGNDLTPRALGQAMLSARCDYGMHLDMNGPNTGFEFYRTGRADELPALPRRPRQGYEAEGEVEGAPGIVYRARKLVPAMPHRAPRYIRRNARDFFYLLRRAVLPGAPLRTPVQPAQSTEGHWSVGGLGDTPFPWPMARTRLRPDPARPERWVHLLAIDPRRVTLAPGDATTGVVARIVTAAPPVDSGPLRLTLADTPAPRWTIASQGLGLAVQAITETTPVSRGACVNADGFLVVAVADQPLPGIAWRALDLAGCGSVRVGLPGAVFSLPTDGSAVAGDASVAGVPSLALVLRAAPGGRRIFPEVRPVAPAVWYPVQSRRVRYFPAHGNNVTVEVRLVGQRPFIQRLSGVAEQYFRLPDGGVLAPPLRE